MMNKREFYIETPIGKLRVYAKHDVDCAQDFPGVFIDWVREDEDEDDMLCCVEYDSISKIMMTSVYEPYKDEPLEVIRYI